MASKSSTFTNELKNKLQNRKSSSEETSAVVAPVPEPVVVVANTHKEPAEAPIFLEAVEPKSARRESVAISSMKRQFSGSSLATSVPAKDEWKDPPAAEPKKAVQDPAAFKAFFARRPKRNDEQIPHSSAPVPTDKVTASHTVNHFEYVAASFKSIMTDALTNGKFAFWVGPDREFVKGLTLLYIL
jgi:hypothetical protein